jgi:signal transduction histidine kinase
MTLWRFPCLTSSAGLAWLLALWLVGFAPPVAAQTQMLELTQARASVTVKGATIVQDLQLPYHWDRFNQGQQGEAEFDLQFELPEVPVDPWSLYLPRLGNAYEIWLNGTLLQRQGDLLRHNGADYSGVPRRVAIAPGLLRLSNLIRVRIRADVGRRGGLSKLTVGPQDEVNIAYLDRYRWSGVGSLVVAGISLLVGLMALSLWATQTDRTRPGRPQRDQLYLFAALAELCWAFAVANTLIEDPPLPWPWWGVLSVVAIGVWSCFMTLFSVEVAGWGEGVAARWLRRWLGLHVASSVVLASWALAGGQPLALTLWYAAGGVTTLVFGLLFLWRAAHRRSPLAHKLVALALLINVVTGLRDLYVFRIDPAYGEITWIRYSSMLFGLVLGYIVVTRFRTASVQASDLLATLAERVSQKETELEQSYRQVEILAREQERSAERTRILRDMHDGVGSHISSAIRQLESGRASHDELLLTLRDSLDQLKLSIDAINLPQGDVNALLANLRYRLEPRFTAIDIELQWDVDLLPVLGHLDASAMRQLQYMLFEALSNVLQHAQAKALRVEAYAEPEQQNPDQLPIVVRVVDDGCGFDVQSTRRKGIASMRERAAAIGAHLNLTSQPGQTVVEIRLG